MKYQLIIALLLIPFAAAVQIDMVYYDAFTEAGSEFILLSHDGATTDLTGWTIASPTSETDATLIGEISTQGTFLIADTGWSITKDNATWPEADYEETLTLPNTNGFVQLIDEAGNIVSTVGYGTGERFEGNPAGTTQEGEALVRISNTGNNGIDFISQTPIFSTPQNTSEEEESTNLIINITNSAPTLDDVLIEDDSEEPGIQLIMQEGRNISISFTVIDENTLVHTIVTINNQTVFSGSEHTQETINTSIELTADTSIVIEIQDEEHVVRHEETITFLSSVSITLPHQVSLAMNPASEALTTLAVHNTGSTQVNLHIKGNRPTLLDNVLGNVWYALLGDEYEVQELFRTHAVGLEPGEQLDMNLRVEAGFVPTGSYTGQIVVVGVPV